MSFFFPDLPPRAATLGHCAVKVLPTPTPSGSLDWLIPETRLRHAEL